MNRRNYFVKQFYVFLGFLILGLLMATGGIIQLIVSQTEENPAGQMLLSMAIFFITVGLINIVRYYPLLKDESAAKKAWAEKNDERNLSIRNQAGYAAFLFYLVISIVSLLVYSNLTRHSPGFDGLWFFLAFTVLGPTIFFVGYLMWLHKRE